MKTIRGLLFCLLCAAAWGGTSVSQGGITWYFGGSYTTGRFANGDWWVVGPVTIDSITPHFDGRNNGWQVNPGLAGAHGLQAGCYRNDTQFDARLVPALPYTAQAGESILKTTPEFGTPVGTSGYRPCIAFAAVLTVLAEVPPDSGATVFRPPYVGTDKPLYRTTNLRTDLLPSLEPVEGITTLQWVVDRFGPVQLDHGLGALGRSLRPTHNLGDYAGDNGADEGAAAVRLMFNEPVAARMPALTAYVQCGIDIHHMVQMGQTWPAGGGEQPAHRLPWVFAAVMLDDPAMKAANRATELYNDRHTQYGADSVSLFGQNHHSWSERNYWASLVSKGGNKTQADPYGYIDGGTRPGGVYQDCCTSQPWKAQLTAFYLMPGLQDVWWNPGLDAYVQRWVTFGTWTQPDPCAPPEATMDNYGITFGPDGKGGCIRDTDPSDGIGRFPDLHGTNVDGGARKRGTITAVWEEYPDLMKPVTAVRTSGTIQPVSRRTIGLKELLDNPACYRVFGISGEPVVPAGGLPYGIYIVTRHPGGRAPVRMLITPGHE